MFKPWKGPKPLKIDKKGSKTVLFGVKKTLFLGVSKQYIARDFSKSPNGGTQGGGAARRYGVPGRLYREKRGRHPPIFAGPFWRVKTLKNEHFSSENHCFLLFFHDFRPKIEEKPVL